MVKALLGLFDFSYIIEKKKDLILLYSFMAVYLVCSFNVLPPDIPLALSLIIFVVASTKTSFFMFVFYLLWEYVTVFSFGVTLVLLLQVIMLIKLLLSGSLSTSGYTYLQLKYRRLQIPLIIALTIYGCICFITSTSFTGIGMVFKALIVLFGINYLKDDVNASLLFKSIYHLLMISVSITAIYGLFNDTGLERWIGGLGDTVSQLYGTLGTTRTGIFFVLSCLYFLFYVENKIVKWLGTIVFVILTFMTVSLTAILLLIGAFGLYMLSKGKLVKMIWISLVILAVTVVSFPVWSKLSFVEPIVYRVSFAIEAYNSGDLNKATTGREDLSEYYMERMKTGPLINKVFGFGATSAIQTGGDQYSHNSYIDMMFYSGYLGLFLFLLYEIKKILLLRNRPYFYQYLSLKAIILVAAFTVSIMSSTYFCFLSFI